MLREKVTADDLRLYEILRHPALFQEFVRNIDRDPQLPEFHLSPKQKAIVCDFSTDVSVATSRSFGKSLSVAGILTWLLANSAFLGGYITYIVPNKVHLKPVWNELTTLFRTNSLLEHFIPKGGGINGSDWEIRLLSGAMLQCRITGTGGDGRNVQGLHSPFIVADEAALLNWRDWEEMFPTLNRFQRGYRLITAGVHTGQRDKNVLYATDQVLDSFSKHRGSAFDNPRYTEEDHKRDIERHGGTDSPSYQRQVLGLSGPPEHAIFDRELFRIGNYPIYKITINGLQLRDDITNFFDKLRAIPPLPADAQYAIFGFDLGYNEPSAWWIMYKAKDGLIKFHCRIELQKVAYPIQAKLIDFLDTKFNPIVIGIDEGSVGFSEIQRMKMDETLIHKNYEDRVVPWASQGNIELGYDTDGNKITQLIKPFSVNLAQEWSNTHRVVFSSTDLEFISELERMTYMRTEAGRLVYRTSSPTGGLKGDDHFTTGFLCGLFAYHVKVELEEMNPRKRKLAGARWI